MTEYELASLFSQTQADIVSGLSLYVSLLFGFIVASYLAAHHLNRAMLVLALGLYTWFSLIFCANRSRQFLLSAAKRSIICAQASKPPT